MLSDVAADTLQGHTGNSMFWERACPGLLNTYPLFSPSSLDLALGYPIRAHLARNAAAASLHVHTRAQCVEHSRALLQTLCAAAGRRGSDPARSNPAAQCKCTMPGTLMHIGGSDAFIASRSLMREKKKQMDLSLTKANNVSCCLRPRPLCAFCLITLFHATCNPLTFPIRITYGCVQHFMRVEGASFCHCKAQRLHRPLEMICGNPVQNVKINTELHNNGSELVFE